MSSAPRRSLWQQAGASGASVGVTQPLAGQAAPVTTPPPAPSAMNATASAGNGAASQAPGRQSARPPAASSAPAAPAFPFFGGGGTFAGFGGFGTPAVTATQFCDKYEKNCGFGGSQRYPDRAMCEQGYSSHTDQQACYNMHLDTAIAGTAAGCNGQASTLCFNLHCPHATGMGGYCM